MTNISYQVVLLIISWKADFLIVSLDPTRKAQRVDLQAVAVELSGQAASSVLTPQAGLLSPEKLLGFLARLVLRATRRRLGAPHRRCRPLHLLQCHRPLSWTTGALLAVSPSVPHPDTDEPAPSP